MLSNITHSKKEVVGLPEGEGVLLPTLKKGKRGDRIFLKRKKHSTQQV